MNHSLPMLALLAALSLSACDKQPTVVNVPAPIVVQGPAGPQGAAGDQGKQGTPGTDGSKGDVGRPGDGATVIVMPPAASAPAN